MDNEIDFNFQDLTRMLKEKIGLILMITLGALIIAAIFSFFIIDPEYEANTSIIVGKPVETGKESATQYNDVMMYQKLVKTYSEIAKSTLVAEGAIDKIGNGVTLEKIKSSVTVSSKADTQIIVITARSESPVEAYKMTNAVADSFIETAKKVLPNGGDVRVMDKAEVPKAPVSPNKKMNLAIAFILGLMVSVGMVFLLEHLDSTIKTEEDIEKHLGIPVIGVIPKLAEPNSKR